MNPNDSLQLLQDIHARQVRMETRLCVLVEALGLATKINSVHGPVKQRDADVTVRRNGAEGETA